MNVSTSVTQQMSQQSEGAYFFTSGFSAVISRRGNKIFLCFWFKYILLVFKWVSVRHCLCGSVSILSVFERISLEWVSSPAAGCKEDKSSHTHGPGTGEAS